MLESSNPENTFKSKKSKPNHARLAQRFWPESLVQTIQGGSTNTVQFPQQTVQIISSDLKDGVPLAVVSSNNQLVSTGIPIQCVQSDKLPLLTILTCPPQTLNQTELVASNNNSVTENVGIVTSVSLENADREISAKSDVVSEQDFSHSELQITNP